MNNEADIGDDRFNDNAFMNKTKGNVNDDVAKHLKISPPQLYLQLTLTLCCQCRYHLLLALLLMLQLVLVVLVQLADC